MIGLYWDVGRMIIDRQKDEGWGRSVVERLARDLQAELRGVHGFSTSNLWRMRGFYRTYADSPNLAPLVREIGWSHNLVILERCKDHQEREFYLRMTRRRMGWTRRVLVHQIENQTYEKTLLSQTNFDETLPTPIRSQARLAVKDSYTFDFLELADEHNERQLEAAILARVEPFLREMGGLFSFVGSQFREVSARVHVGKLQFYLAVLDDKVRLPGENPPIGIILCKSKDETIVEYALHESNKPIGVASYQIVRELPQELRSQLPGPDQVAMLLEGLEAESG